MTFWVAGATIAGAVIGGVSSSKASKKGIKGQEKAARIFREGTEKAGATSTELINNARRLTRRAARQNLQLLGKTRQQVTEPFQQGNVAAQGAIAAGLQQQQNALLGAPTDFSAFQPQEIRIPNKINTAGLKLNLPAQQPPPNPLAGPLNIPINPGNFLGGVR